MLNARAEIIPNLAKALLARARHHSRHPIPASSPA